MAAPAPLGGALESGLRRARSRVPGVAAPMPFGGALEERLAVGKVALCAASAALHGLSFEEESAREGDGGAVARLTYEAP